MGAVSAATEHRGDLHPLVELVAHQFEGFPGGVVDPRELALGELLRFGLPPRPPRTQPQLRRVWERALGRPTELRSFEFDAKRFLAEDVRPTFRETNKGVSASRYETSRNWSGATIAANSDESLVQVWGSWKLPELTAPPPDPMGRPAALSMWVGLDGQRRYFESSLPQIGTTASIDSSEPPLQAWTQWWSRESETTLPVPIPNFPLNPNDRVIAAVTVLDPVSVLFLIVNLTVDPAVGVAILGISPKITRKNGLVERPRITGATAEWVLERPRIPFSPNLVRFPRYTPTKFDFCGATAGRTVDLAGVLDGHGRDLLDARLIRMYERLHQPERTAFISMPKLDGTETVKLHYGGFEG